ncbi:hypothetical protein COY28_00365 [Candidatus Woesearchaeota archaeon CG_4_10_14_0_2_um_filter_57_5]|nr:MAG: hypothetical protein AUJ68_02275 [Candidatus Woesearchaeota archaeon CG1_02_57_44]PIN70829.1 MAG: hypothetical protein COV94_01105 [Candidatus Woesearchaeota archaeon CG11_big_fil_rev_8_21_14_0_20_57_5]PIZ57064.1 MAG: hypothetical protein COY28_00365 [Candidatus Woesearchaeota archaeon CG_4_10_14_0_2_um_filter_57_5]
MAPPGSATDLVMQMRSQGVSPNQIIHNLQQQGFSPQDVFDAMNQADMQSGVSGQYGDDFSPQGIENPMPQSPPASPPMQGPPQSQGMGTMMGQGMSQDPGFSGTHIEELVEAVIEEKWNELVKNINKIIEWKSKVDQKLAQLEQEMNDLKSEFTDLHKAILGKISEYDQNITNVGTEIKAMEKVFQKVLPTFTENINELSRLTSEMKGIKPDTGSRQPDNSPSATRRPQPGDLAGRL